MATCSECGINLPPTGRICPACGTQRPSFISKVIGLAIFVAIIAVIGETCGHKATDSTSSVTTPPTSQSK